MPKEPQSLSIIFSFRNEEEVLPELIRRVQAVSHKEQSQGNISDYELIFVNDNSSDRSLDILKEHIQKDANIRVLNMSRRFGVSPCVLAGMEYAKSDIVVYMDSDLQDPPEVIHELMRRWKEKDLDVIHTVRKSRKGESFLKLLITRIGYILIDKFSDINIPIEAGDFKMLSRRAVDHLVQLKEKHPYMRGLVCWVGFNQDIIGYDRDSRHAGKTKFNVLSKDVINNFFSSALISFSSAPLKIAAILGVTAIVFDLVLILHVLGEKIKGTAIPGWTAIMIAVLFLGGVQLFCIGIMGLYLNSIHEESRGRPNYILESKTNFPEDDESSA